MKISDAGLSLIKESEALRLRVYKCAAGRETIGWGHVLLPDEKYTTITAVEAEELLKKDVRRTEDGVNGFLLCDITQNGFDALVSFTFNIGVNAFRNSTLLRKLNEKRTHNANCDLQIANEFLRWNKSNGKILRGLCVRRRKERRLFLKDCENIERGGG